MPLKSLDSFHPDSPERQAMVYGMEIRVHRLPPRPCPGGVALEALEGAQSHAACLRVSHVLQIKFRTPFFLRKPGRHPL